MVDNIVTYLEQLDLSEIEAKIYLKLLESGAISVKDLAQQIGIKRTTAYIYIDPLIENGLVIKVVKGARQLIAANEPSSLEYLVDKKTEMAKAIRSQFPGILKTLNVSLSQHSDINDAEIKYYKGKIGVKKIYEEALKAKELRSYANLSEIENLTPENFEMFFDAFKNNPQLKLKEIVNDSPNTRKQTKFLSQQKRYEYKFFPLNIKMPAADILIFDGKVGIINVKDKASGVILQNVEYYTVSKELFDFIWSLLPEVNI